MATLLIIRSPPLAGRTFRLPIIMALAVFPSPMAIQRLRNGRVTPRNIPCGFPWRRRTSTPQVAMTSSGTLNGLDILMLAAVQANLATDVQVGGRQYPTTGPLQTIVAKNVGY